MYNKENITEKFDNIEVEKIEKVGGTFKNDAGQDINWHGYKVTIDLGNGYKIKAKVDKVYNELLDEMEEEKEEE